MQKKKCKQKFKPLSSATPEEMREAFLMAGLWISSVLQGHTISGAFSVANLGIPAVEYFPMKAYTTLNSPDCEWKWKVGSKLSTLFINVMRSDMAHVLRDYIESGEPTVIPSSYLVREEESDGWDDSNNILEVDPAQKLNGYQMKSDMEMLEELTQKESRYNEAYMIAKEAAKGTPILEEYVELAFTLPDHRAISKKMRITKQRVLDLEDELIRRIYSLLDK